MIFLERENGENKKQQEPLYLFAKELIYASNVYIINYLNWEY